MWFVFVFFLVVYPGAILAKEPLAKEPLAKELVAEEPRLTESRRLVHAYAEQLQTALQQVLHSGGPTQAIAVCRDIAPEIASELSRASGAKVSRVSRRYRNPMNAPEDWQRQVLKDFQRRAAKPGERLEYFNQDQRGVQYMAGIQLKPLCLACHGSVLAEGVKQQLATDYPHDQATGYRAGDLRGAFTVSWPRDIEDLQ